VSEVSSADDFRDVAAFITPAPPARWPYLQLAAFNGLRNNIAVACWTVGRMSPPPTRLQRFSRAFPTTASTAGCATWPPRSCTTVDPERYPLMTRWVWDRRPTPACCAKSGSAKKTDHIRSTCRRLRATFATLREELGSS
jgi:hypothetical protein